MIFLGIDPTAGRRPLNYALLDGKLNIVAEGAGQLDDLLQVIAPYPDILCAVDAPLRPNLGLMADPEVRRQFGLSAKSKTWAQYRVCEFELRRRNIKLYNTPAEADAPSWMQTGWQLYAQLQTAGFAVYPTDSAARQLFEVHPHATFTARLGHLPYRKDILEGRMQRQLVLYDEGVQLPDALETLEEITRHHLLRGTLALRGLRTHDELDALAAALAAYFTHTRPREITLVGSPVDGQIVVPTAQLKDHYE